MLMNQKPEAKRLSRRGGSSQTEEMPSDQTFEHDFLVESSSGSHQRWKTYSPPAPLESLQHLLSQFQTRRRGGWRHDDDLVLECEKIWLGELQKALERVMILKRRAQLECQASDDNLVIVDLHDNSGERVVTPEPDPTTREIVQGCVWAECDVSSGHDALRPDSGQPR